MKRDDLIHPVVSGNKWRKCQGFVANLKTSTTVLTFGGAYSNHLAATAALLKAHGNPGILVVRGEELAPTSNHVLRFCSEMGMQLQFVSRKEFRALRDKSWEPSAEQLAHWKVPEDVALLPEGGSGPHNAQGCAALWDELPWEPNQLWISAGTAGTVQGILRAMPENSATKVVVVSAVRGAQREAAATQAIAQAKNIALEWIDEQWGGFGKSAPALEQHTADFVAHTGIHLDPVYNAKLWYALNKRRPEGRLVWINTGGYKPELGLSS